MPQPFALGSGWRSEQSGAPAGLGGGRDSAVKARAFVTGGPPAPGIQGVPLEEGGGPGGTL